MITVELADKMDTKRLLAYYRSLRKKLEQHKKRYWCDSCWEFHFPEQSEDTKWHDEYDELKIHKKKIKLILDNRGNI
jgi:ribonuclease D